MLTQNLRTALFSALCLASAATASADTWVITDGPGRGTVLVTDGSGSTDVSWGRNHLFQANGYITWDEEGNYFFTGEIEGERRSEGHAWGKVRKLDGGLLPLGQFIAHLNSATNVILGGTWGSECGPNGTTALADLCAAEELIDTLKSMIDDRVQDRRKRRKLKDKADKLKVRIGQAKALLEGAQNGPGAALALVQANSGRLRDKVKKFARDMMRYMGD